MSRIPSGSDYDGWVRLLASSQRRQQAKRHLMRIGSPALPALRRGLRDTDPMVRRLCAIILDHLVDDASVPDLVAAVDDPDPRVATRALHALACDACKQNACRPGDELFVPKAFELLDHENPDVRAAAIDALARAAGRDPELAPRLIDAAEREPNPGLRTMARRRAARAAARLG